MKFWGKVMFSQVFVCPDGEGVSKTETPPDRDPPDTNPLDRDLL